MSHLRLKHPIHGETLLNIEQILAITTKKRRTVLRWIQEPDKIDSDSLKLLTVYAFGVFPSTTGHWQDLYIKDGVIYSSLQKRFSVKSGELSNLWLTYQENRYLRNEFIKKVYYSIN